MRTERKPSPFWRVCADRRYFTVCGEHYTYCQIDFVGSDGRASDFKYDQKEVRSFSDKILFSEWFAR